MTRLGIRAVPCAVLLCSSLLMAQVAVTTYQNDNYHSGVNARETALTPATVNVQNFGLRTTLPVQGFVYAQPLYVPHVTINGTSHNVVYIATEHDQVYAFDANSGQQLWHASFLPNPSALRITSPISSLDANCTDLVPEIGITGTPVIDINSNTMYLVANTKVVDLQLQTTNFYQTLHALDIRSGAERSIPRPITATYPGNGSGSVGGVLTFDPLVEGQRGSLLLANGQIYVSWASHCDLGNYHGWLMSFNEGNMAPTGVFVDTPNSYEGGYWGGGAGPVADSTGVLYLATGNGGFDANLAGNDFGDSILKVTWSGSGNKFTLTDYFTPWDEQTLDYYDSDLGSGGVTLLPDAPGTTYPHLLIQAGKEGTIDLVNRDNMGHFHGGNDSQIVQTLPFAIGGIWGSPAFWNNTAYFGGSYDHVKAFAFNSGAERLSTTATSTSPETYNFPGPTPAISANGTTNGIVWVIETDTYGGGNAVLRAYDATNLGNELYNSEQNPGRDNAGLAVKFTVPTVADGHVFVGVENQVSVYGLLP